MATKEKFKRKQSTKAIKICFIGDNDEIEIKNRNKIINNYLQFINYPIDQKGNKTVKREFNNTIEELEIHDICEKNETLINESYCVIIVFDMNNYKAFDNVIDCWLIWLRDQCHYNKKIGIIGNYANDLDSIHYRITNDEIYDLIGSSETSSIFIRVGELSDEEKGKKIDELITNILFINKPKDIKEGGCIVY